MYSPFVCGDISLAALENALNLAITNRKQITTIEKQLADLRNERVVLSDSLWDVLKRLRNAVKAAYGDDSSEYELIGGTRLSEKKKPVKKAATTPS